MTTSHIFSSALLFCLLCCMTACENDQREIDVWTKDKVMVEEARSMESYLSQNGKIKAKLTAPVMLRVVANNVSDTLFAEFPKSLHCDFYDDSSKLETWLDSKYGKYYENLNKVYLRDSVVVITVSGDTLRAPDLWWDQASGLFYTDKPAQYSTSTRNIFGMKGMEATQDLKRVTFNHGEGIIKVTETGFPK